MKFRGGIFIATLCVGLAMRAADPTIEFSGVLTNEGHTKLALTNKTDGVTRWVEPGDSFFGYTVIRYDSKDDVVFLNRNGTESRVALTAAKPPTEAIAVAPSPPPAATGLAAAPSTGLPASTEAAANGIRGNLRTLAAAARRYQLERGVTTVTYADLVGPDKPIRELRPVAGENYSNLIFTPSGTIASVTMADGAPVSVEIAPVTTPIPQVVAPGLAAGAASGNPPPTSAPTPAAPTQAPAAANAPAPESLEPTGRAAAGTYSVETNDTWESIAQKTGVSVQKLKELNAPLASGSSLPAGQAVRLR